MFSRCSVGVVPHVDVFLMYLWGGRRLSMSYSSAILKVPPPSLGSFKKLLRILYISQI